jgi:hypothetical protein
LGFLDFPLWSPQRNNENKSCLNDIKFWEVWRKPKTSRFWKLQLSKGQIILKWFFGVFDFLQKTNENKSTWGIIEIKSNSFVHFFGGKWRHQKPFWNYLTFMSSGTQKASNVWHPYLRILFPFVFLYQTSNIFRA